MAQKSKFSELFKPWFADGTVTLASIKPPHHYLTKNHERFENVTLNYLDIPALKTGLDYVNAVGRQRINKRVNSLSKYLFNKLNNLNHKK
ncbi:aminotransferase class V-fold PLP-dependent enzyme [Leeuwenhoekiella polynyae]|uniref:aminotransferase class V-fold PLP-dependent enzyme n=1 Tax=Leeuwenhoekiella polynyae TaxID=1550906 RepID=UPI00362C33EB